MRVLFVAQEISYEPQGIMSMSAVLKQGGHDVALTVADIEDPVAYAVDYQPDIVAYSVMTGSQRGYFDTNLKIREAVNPVRAGGGQEAALLRVRRTTSHLLSRDGDRARRGRDMRGRRRGRAARPGRRARSRNGTYRTDIPNWWFNVDGEVVKNPPRPADSRAVGPAAARPGADLRQDPPPGRRQDQALHQLAGAARTRARIASTTPITRFTSARSAASSAAWTT